MTLPDSTKIKLNSLSVGTPHILIIDVMHPTFSEPARIIADTQDLTMPDGTFYQALPVDVKLPSDTSKNSSAKLEIDNVGRVLTDEVERARGLDGGTCRMRSFFRDDLSTVIQDYVMTITKMDMNVHKVTLSLGFEDLLNRPAVRISYRPETTPGLF